VAGRVVGYLAVCDPPQQTIDELAETMLASRSAITPGRSSCLRGTGPCAASAPRATGSSGSASLRRPWSRAGSILWSTRSWRGWPREGLGVLGDAPADRRAFLEEVAALADFLAEKMPAVFEEWRARREALRSSGEGEKGQS